MPEGVKELNIITSLGNILFLEKNDGRLYPFVQDFLFWFGFVFMVVDYFFLLQMQNEGAANISHTKVCFNISNLNIKLD